MIMATDNISTALVESEINLVKEEFGRRCTVLQQQDIYNITVHLDVPGCSVKFQLTKDYPSESVQIFVRGLDEARKEELLNELNLKNAGLECKTSGFIKLLIQSANDWLSSQNLCPVKEDASHKKSRQPNNLYKTGAKSKKKGTVAEEQVFQKKPPMKTADDVIKRIIWDDNLAAEHFVVGYIDRFRGIIEKEFSAFSWEDIASVGIDVLAIPKHRIVYFKYKSMVVWDKSERLDLIFNSTKSSQKNIYETIEEYEKSLPGGKMEDVENVAQCDDRQNPVTHFVATRVTDQLVLNKLADIQDKVLEYEPLYAKFLAPPSTAHITLLVLRLKTQEQVTDACRVLISSKEKLQSIIKRDVKLNFKGLGNFGQGVLFGAVEPNEDFLDLQKTLFDLYHEAGLIGEDTRKRGIRSFTPHLTVFKGAKIKDDVISQLMTDSHYRQYDFGSDLVSELQLCETGAAKQDDGYYSVIKSVEV